jgi:hypothetical protein
METLTINGDTIMPQIRVTFIENSDSIMVDKPCWNCHKLDCTCDDEYERYRDQKDQADYEALHSDRIYDNEY